jgi:hypothetical protein
MIIHIDGKDYLLPQHVEDRLLSQFYQLFAELYMSPMIPQPVRLMMKPLARKELQKQEEKLNREGLNGKAVRPVDGEDPALRFLELEVGKFRGEGKLKDVTLHIGTEGDSATISAFSISLPRPTQAGGQDTARGDIGVGKDNGGKAARHWGR